MARDVFRPAEEIELVSVEQDRMQFRHPLIRSGVLQNETVARRQSANGALADVLAGQPYRRSWHRAQSIVGPDDAVADELETAAADALARGAVMTAVATLERAAELSTSSARRGHRLLVAAEHAFGLGRAELVDRLVEEAARTDLSELDWARMQWLREIFDDGVPGDAVRVVELCDIAPRSASIRRSGPRPQPADGRGPAMLVGRHRRRRAGSRRGRARRPGRGLLRTRATSRRSRWRSP